MTTAEDIAAEREACAKVAEADIRDGFEYRGMTQANTITEWLEQSNGRTAKRIAEAIRTRGEA